jgi:glucoamylase
VGDRYGEHPDGSAWDTTGQGRPWPLLAGERGHFSLAAGTGAAEAIRSLESFAGPELVLPEQVWDADPIPWLELYPGGPTNSVAPLGWAHAEYLKLLAAVAAGAPADIVAPARRRFIEESPRSPAFVWSHAHQVKGFLAGRSVKVQLTAPALVRWSADRWVTQTEVETQDTGLGVFVADLPTEIMRPGAAMEFTAEYADAWEGRNYQLVCRAPT